MKSLEHQIRKKLKEKASKEYKAIYTERLNSYGVSDASELTDEQLCTLLEICIEDYAQYVQEWLIEHQWQYLLGQSIDTMDIAFALSVRNFDFMTQYTYAYSKQVGLQTRGPWELKKDFVTLEEGRQVYQIPAGREINEVLWFTRAELNEMLIDPFLGAFGGMGGGGVGGFSQMGIVGSYYMMPAFDLLLRMQDRNIKNRLIGGELTYRITAGPNGTKLVHLHNVPGGKFDFGSIKQKNYNVWYWYYDTMDRDTCLKDNKDVIKLPSDVDTEQLVWENLNKPAQNWVRKYLIAYSKEGLGRIWGKFSGDLQVPDSQVKLDYQSLITVGKDEKSKLVEELMARLERLRPDKLLERKAGEAENLNKSLKFRAMPAPINII